MNCAAKHAVSERRADSPTAYTPQYLPQSFHRYDPGRISSSHGMMLLTSFCLHIFNYFPSTNLMDKIVVPLGSLPVLGDVELVQRPSKRWVLYTSSAEEIGA